MNNIPSMLKEWLWLFRWSSSQSRSLVTLNETRKDRKVSGEAHQHQVFLLSGQRYIPQELSSFCRGILEDDHNEAGGQLCLFVPMCSNRYGINKVSHSATHD